MRSIGFLIATCLAGSASAQDSTLEALLNIPMVSTVIYDPDTPVSFETREQINEAWGGADYYGAFAVHPSGAYGYSTESNSTAGAVASALRFCRDVTPKDGLCTIAAYLMPKGVSGEDLPPISPNIVNGIYEVMGLNEDGYAAIASSPDGAWGSALNGPTPEAAMSLAVESCEEWRLGGDETPLSNVACDVVVVFHSDVELPE